MIRYCKMFLKELNRKFENLFGWVFINGFKRERWMEMVEQNSKPRRKFGKVVVTGGAGFIGSHLVDLLRHHCDEVHVIDCLTYAGDIDNLDYHIPGSLPYPIQESHFAKIDIADREAIMSYFEGKDFDAIIHLAAESHVDRSIENPAQFMQTNIMGTFNLLEAALKLHANNPDFIFYHVSTDEVFGSLDLYELRKFHEDTAYDPRSPYSASKASSDHLVRAYHHTYNLPVLISNCSNNYGTRQYPEKLIPVVIRSLVERKPIPIYGHGSNMRDWLHVEDHALGIWEIMKNGKIGDTYCIGGGNVVSNMRLVTTICHLYDNITGTERSTDLITYVEDRKGHDMKYAVSYAKMRIELGWKPRKNFKEGLSETIKWYIKKFQDENNQD